MVTDTPPPVHHQPLSVIDSTRFTQSELLALSRCSSQSVLDQREVLIPEIDRSIFNESDATRQQTYAEIRLHNNRRKRRSKISPVREVGLDVGNSDLDENRLIVRYLKDLIKTSPLHDPAVEERLKWNDERMVDGKVEGGGDVKTKRKKRKKGEGMAVDEEIVNRNGVVVDLAALENKLDPYGEELKRRTAGLVSEEDCLGFLRGLDGEWGSTRRKRRIVDACEFGDHLPVRWKLLLALMRREGRIWLYCRRYISPRGQEFVSCKEVVLHLRSLFGVSNDPVIDVNADNIQIPAGTLVKEDSLRNSNFPIAAVHISSECEQERGLPLEGIEKLVDVQISSLFECHQCKLVFHEKKFYLQHVLSCHEKTTKRYRLGSGVTNGVILDHGQYECQFCYRTFQKRDSYGSHVADHIIGSNNESLDRRTYAYAGINANLIAFSNGSIKLFSGKGDGSMKISSSHCLDTSDTADKNECHGGLALVKPNLAASDSNLCYKLVSDSLSAPDVEYSISKDEILNHIPENQDIENNHGNQLKFERKNDLVNVVRSEKARIDCPIGKTITRNDDFPEPTDQHSDVLESQIQLLSDTYEKSAYENTSPRCVKDSEQSNSVGKEVNYEGHTYELEINTDTLVKQNQEQNVISFGETLSSRDLSEWGSMVQPSGNLTDFSSTTCKGEELSSLRQKLESVADLDLDYDVQTAVELDTNTDTRVKQILQNVMISGEIVSSADFGKSGSMVQPSYHPTKFSTASCEGKELSNIQQKLEKVADFELEHSVRVNELEKRINTHMKENPELYIMTCGEITSSGDNGKSGSAVKLSDHHFSSTLCKGEGLSSLRQKLRSAGEIESEYSVQPANTLNTTTDTPMIHNLEQNVTTSNEITSSCGDFCTSKAMLQQSDYLTEFGSTPCEGEQFSNFCPKLETAGGVELEYNHEFKTNIDTQIMQNLERSVIASGEMVFSEDIGKSGLMVQPLDYIAEFSSIPCEVSDLSSFRKMPESIAELEEIKLDDIETPKISSPIREESPPLPVVPMDIEKDAEVNEFDANRVEVEGTLCSMECRLQVTAECVWCNSEFIYEVVNSELLADSVGFMCTTCRAKISAQFNGSSMV